MKSKRSIAKATTEGPAAWVIPADERRPYDAADLVNLLRRQGCEVHASSKPLKSKDGEFPAGSYVARMDQLLFNAVMNFDNLSPKKPVATSNDE